MERELPINYGTKLKCKCGSKLFCLYVNKAGVLTTACHKCMVVAMENKPKTQQPIPGDSELQNNELHT